MGTQTVNVIHACRWCDHLHYMPNDSCWCDAEQTRKKMSSCQKLNRCESYELNETDALYCLIEIELTPEEKEARRKSWLQEQKRRKQGRREMLKAAGLCADCGKRPAAPNRVTCIQCLKSKSARDKQRNEESRRARREMANVD